MSENKLEKIVSLAKRRGFVYPSSEIYGGLAGMWDLGTLGSRMLHNIKEAWWKKFVIDREDMHEITATVMMPEKVWASSGHLENFTDPLDDEKFNTMFKTEAGARKDETVDVYLRPELAQGMFINFKNIIDSYHPKLPFGIAQIGKCFRNEISPRDFLFRVREFDLMEFEYFVKESQWEKYFEYWQKEIWNWIKEVGIDESRVHEMEVSEEDRAHYSKRTIDFEFDFSFGRKELYGLAYRTDHDLKNHGLDYHDEESGERFIPHVVEPTFGAGRTLLALLESAYTEDELGGDTRIFLKLKPHIAPIKVAVFPLMKNKPELVEKAREIYGNIKKEIPSTVFDDNGNVGKRYRRQDEIGTPFCITIDFDTLEKDSVTVRDRDTGKQERIDTKELLGYIQGRLR
ncbi:MAG: glycine--tRNA ligase [Patescibacteria group bacterium]